MRCVCGYKSGDCIGLAECHDAFAKKLKLKMYPCKKCGKKHSPKNLFIYVDGNNGAITKNSQELCKACYIATWGDK